MDCLFLGDTERTAHFCGGKMNIQPTDLGKDRVTDRKSLHGHCGAHAHGHSHAMSDIENNGRRLFLAAALIGGFMIIEVIGGLISGSLALLADAGHMLSDFASLILAWYAFHVSKQPATAAFSYGKDRFQVVAAFINALTMFFLCIWISVEAIGRIIEPVEVLSGTMMVVAVVGLAVNIAAFAVLSTADQDNMNVRGAMMHVLGDVLGSVAAIAAAGIIMATGWVLADPLLSLVVVTIIARHAYPLLRQSGHILMQGTPAELDPVEIRQDLVAHVPGVTGVEQIHLWSLTQTRQMATLRTSLADGVDAAAAVDGIKERLGSQFGIEHVTVEIAYGEHLHR